MDAKVFISIVDEDGIVLERFSVSRSSRTTLGTAERLNALAADVREHVERRFNVEEA
jgi:hypothetical protein